MSTILDALRRVQREREVRDLRESVFGDEPLLRTRRRRWPWGVLILVVLLTAGSAGAWYVWPGAQAIQIALGVDSEEEQVPARVREARRRAEASRQRARARSPSESRVAAATARQAVAPGREATSPRPPRVQRRPPAAASGPRETGAAEPTGTAVANARPPARPPRPTRTAAREGALPPPAAADEESIAPGRPSQSTGPSEPQDDEAPDIDLRLRLEAVQPRDSDPEGDLIASTTSEYGFPDLALESVRWHPEPERRAARILLDQTRPLDAREGDIVAGVAIHRIDPGAVELRLGNARRRIKIGR